MSWQRLVSCEHGGTAVPLPYTVPLLAGTAGRDDGQRGAGARLLEFASQFARAWSARFEAVRVHRALVDIAMPLGDPRLFPRSQAVPSEGARQDVLRHYYHPHRQRLRALVREAATQGQTTLHVSVGFLEDSPAPRERVRLIVAGDRPVERGLVSRWVGALPSFPAVRDLNVTATVEVAAQERPSVPAWLREQEDRYVGVVASFDPQLVMSDGAMELARSMAEALHRASSVRPSRGMPVDAAFLQPHHA